MMVGRRKDSYSTLAYQILNKAGKPMHYMDITKEILKLKNSKGRTPHKTVRSVLYRDDRFTKIDRGTYGLKEWRL